MQQQGNRDTQDRKVTMLALQSRLTHPLEGLNASECVHLLVSGSLLLEALQRGQRHVHQLSLQQRSKPMSTQLHGEDADKRSHQLSTYMHQQHIKCAEPQLLKAVHSTRGHVEKPSAISSQPNTTVKASKTTANTLCKSSPPPGHPHFTVLVCARPGFLAGMCIC